MQISGSAFSTLPVTINRRDELFERRHGERRQSDVGTATQPIGSTVNERGEITRIRTRPAEATSAAAQRSKADGFQMADAFGSRSNTAMLAYRSNGPSIEERLGVELVGVDLYV